MNFDIHADDVIVGRCPLAVESLDGEHKRNDCPMCRAYAVGADSDVEDVLLGMARMILDLQAEVKRVKAELAEIPPTEWGGWPRWEE